jgi:L-iditol 2-dehydrogenase
MSMYANHKTMKVAVYYSNQDVRVEERPVPEIGSGELLVKTEACGLCGGETMEWYLAPRAPKILGHEPTGTVVKTGPGVTKFKEGDRVFAHHHVACMSCHYCNRGHYSLCENYGRSKLDPGGFAEFFRVPAENANLDTLLLPDHVSFEEGTVIEPMACALKGIRMAAIQPGDTVAIVGSGFIGLCYLQLASIFSSGLIFSLDFSDWRLDKAQSLGATYTINPLKENAIEKLRDLNDGRLADIVFITAPSTKAWESAYQLCEKGATLHNTAPSPPGETVRISPNDMFFREITINSSYSTTHKDTRAVLDFLAAKRVDAGALITHRFGLDGVAEAIRLLLDAGESLKSLILPDKSRLSVSTESQLSEARQT